MANNCGNWIKIIGSKESIELIESKLKTIKERNDGLWYETFAEVLELDPKGNHEFGTKWFDAYIERENDETLILSGDSAWGPPTDWLLKLSEKFNVSIQSEYEECGNDFAGYYDCENGEVTRDDEIGYFQYRLNGDRDSAIESVIDNCETFDEFLEEIGKDIELLTEEEIEEVKQELNSVKN